MTTKIQVDAYQALDGTVFLDKEKCEHYDRDIRETKLYKLFHNPDLTEGRGYYGLTYVTVKGRPPTCMLEDWVYENVGARTDFIMGVQPTDAWYLVQVSDPLEHTKSSEGVRGGTYSELTLKWNRGSKGLVKVSGDIK